MIHNIVQMSAEAQTASKLIDTSNCSADNRKRIHASKYARLQIHRNNATRLPLIRETSYPRPYWETRLRRSPPGLVSMWIRPWEGSQDPHQGRDWGNEKSLQSMSFPAEGGLGTDDSLQGRSLIWRLLISNLELLRMNLMLFVIRLVLIGIHTLVLWITTTSQRVSVPVSTRLSVMWVC